MNDNQNSAGKMNIMDLLKNILPFVLPTLESPLDCKEIKLVNPKGNQS